MNNNGNKEDSKQEESITLFEILERLLDGQTLPGAIKLPFSGLGDLILSANFSSRLIQDGETLSDVGLSFLVDGDYN